MSEYVEMVPGKWIVSCVDYAPGVCKGAMFQGIDGIMICETHARARKLIPEEETKVPKGAEAAEEAGAPPSGEPASSSEGSNPTPPEKAGVESEVPVEGEVAPSRP